MDIKILLTSETNQDPGRCEMEMKSDSFLFIDNNGVPLDEGMFSVLLKAACDVIKNERIGCEFVVDGICRGKIIVEPAGSDLQDFHGLNVAFVVNATVDYLKGGQTTTKFFLPKEAKQFHPQLSSFSRNSAKRNFGNCLAN